MGAIAGLCWSCLLVLLFEWFEFRMLLAALVVCPLVGALFVQVAAGALLRLRKLGAILIGALMVPVCAYLFGFGTVWIVDGLLGGDRGTMVFFTHRPLLEEVMDSAYMIACVAVTELPFLTFPLMCLTMVWLEYMLRGAGPADPGGAAAS